MFTRTAQVESLLCTSGGGDAIIVAFQSRCDEVQDHELVIDDQCAELRHV